MFGNRRIRLWTTSFSGCWTITELHSVRLLETLAKDSRLKCKTFPYIFCLCCVCCWNKNLIQLSFKINTCKIINISLYVLQAERDGSNEYSNYQPGSLNTTDQLVNDLNDIDIVFHIGDIAYANGYISQWDQFTSQVEPIASKVPYMIARFVQLFGTFSHLNVDFAFIFYFMKLIEESSFDFSCSGNHERDWPNTGSFYDKTDSGGECGVLAETMFYVPAENRAKFW